MLTVRLVAVALFGLVLAACVRNPIPVSAADAPPLAAEDSARDRLPGVCGLVAMASCGVAHVRWR